MLFQTSTLPELSNYRNFYDAFETVFSQPARVKHLEFSSLLHKMEELRKIVNRLVISEDVIKGVINSHSKNIDNLNKRIDYVEDILVKGIGRTNAKISEDIYNLEEQQKKLKIVMEGNDKRMKEVDSQIVNQREKIHKLETKFICKECGQSFAKNWERRNHINELHRKEVIQNSNTAETSKCYECGDTFDKKVELRNHMKRIHTKYISCSVCNETFQESWRYEVHLESHYIKV